MLLEELGYPQTSPTELACDNEVAVHLTQDKMLISRLKHVQRCEHYVRDMTRDNHIKCGWISSEFQLADMMTKCQVKDLFLHFRSMILKY